MSTGVHAEVKARLFSTYIRPILMYGTENCDLNSRQMEAIQVTEGNIIKRMLAIPRKSRTIPLFQALRLQSTSLKIVKQKQNFFIRLSENQYTRTLLEGICKNNYVGSYLDEICKLMGYSPQKEYKYNT